MNNYILIGAIALILLITSKPCRYQQQNYIGVDTYGNSRYWNDRP